MKKICFLVEYLSYVGGGERAYTNLANMFIKYGHEVTILSLEEGNKSYYSLNPKIKIKSLNIRKREYYNEKYRKLKDIFLLKKTIKKIEEELIKIKYDTIISIGCNMNLVLSICNVKNIKKIGTEHTGYNSVNKILKILRKKFYKNLNTLIVLTERDKIKYDKFLIKGIVKVIPNSLSFNLEEKAKLKNKKIINVGSLSFSKNQDLLIELFSKFLKTNADMEWILEIYGQGKLEQELKNKIKELGLENNVFLKGNVKNIELKLKEASIFCLTSRYEGFPMVLIEAMNCGLPCISFDCPTGPREMIKNEITGFVIEENNYDEYVRKMILLAKNQDLRILQGEEAKNKSMNYTEDKIFKLWKKEL